MTNVTIAYPDEEFDVTVPSDDDRPEQPKRKSKKKRKKIKKPKVYDDHSVAQQKVKKIKNQDAIIR